MRTGGGRPAGGNYKSARKPSDGRQDIYRDCTTASAERVLGKDSNREAKKLSGRKLGNERLRLHERFLQASIAADVFEGKGDRRGACYGATLAEFFWNLKRRAH